MSFSLDHKNNIENLVAKNQVKRFSLYLTVLLVIFLIIALLPVIKIDISAQSRGLVRSQSLPVPIHSIVSGKVERINMSNNIVVQQGDTLLVVTQEKLQAEKAVAQTLSSETQRISNDLRLVISGKGAELNTSLMRQEWQSYQSKIQKLNSKKQQTKLNFDRHKQLFDKGVISKAEFEKFTFEHESIQNEYVTFIQNQKAQWQNRLQELTERNNNLFGTIQQLNTERENYVLIAPTTGVVENFIGIRSEGFVTASQPIAQISPIENLIIETMVSPKDIGLINIGQKVNFQIDAFNYNQWGLASGEVIDIDQNITIQEDQTFFKVRCSIDNTAMNLKNGYTAQISKGMTLTTRFIITRRSLFDLLFDKVDDWLNPKIITK